MQNQTYLNPKYRGFFHRVRLCGNKATADVPEPHGHLAETWMWPGHSLLRYALPVQLMRTGQAPHDPETALHTRRAWSYRENTTPDTLEPRMRALEVRADIEHVDLGFRP